MEAKTSELTGAALDWAVAKCEGHSVYLRHAFITARAIYTNHNGSTLAWHLSQQTNDPIIGNLETGATQYLPAYSTDWAQGGPIIERERIFVRPKTTGGWRCWIYDGKGDGIKFDQSGPTPLIAAIRCYVASKLGDTVDVPEELF